jgi:transposase
LALEIGTMPMIGARMTRRPRRNHSPAFKAKVALAAIKGEKTMVDLAQEFDLHANQIKQWKDQLLEGAAGVFDDGGKEDGRFYQPRFLIWRR